MDRGLQLRADWIGEFADSCLSGIGSVSSKIEVLNLVSRLVSLQLDDYRRDVLAEPDEISLNLIDLLDQIVFELAENITPDNPAQEYIIDDLYARISVYLDVFRGGETYASNLNKRYVTREDTIVIRQRRLKEFVPLLMAEFYEQPSLQRPILHALLAFDGDDLLNFYYGIAKEADSTDIRALSLVGLKKSGTKFRSWRHLSSGDEGFLAMIAYAESFDAGSLERNGLPADLNTFMFVLHFIESNIEMLSDPAALAWVLSALHSVLFIGYYNSSLTSMHESICNILAFTGTGALLKTLRDDECVKKLLELIDFLPRELFERIVPKLSLLGEAFIHRVHGMVGAGKVKFDERESNTMGYVLWKTGNSL